LAEWWLSGESLSVENQKLAEYIMSSFPPPIQAFGGRLQRESSGFENKWIPAQTRSADLAGMTAIYAMNLRYRTVDPTG
jgi:hypothetical protein